MTTVDVPLQDRAYQVVIGDNLFHDGAGQALARIVEGRVCLLVTDTNVAPLYARAAIAMLEDAGADRVAQSTFPAGEQSKNLATMGALYADAVAAGLDRSSIIVGLGGGVTTDMAGFLAATYMRGIDYVQAPTSLLAQVDSAIGGKTGIDLPQGKNLVGAFCQPRLVLVDVAALQTLPARQLRCGLAELVKHGVILDEDFFSSLEQNIDGLLAPDPTVYHHVVKRSCELKAQIVAEDELETSGRRAILNYGHTFGHALELLGDYQGFTHGEAIAIGMGMAADLAVKLAPCPALEELATRQDRLLRALGLPLTATGYSAAAILEAMRQDKKFVGGKNRLILPERLGLAKLVPDVPETLIRQAIEGRRDQS